MAESNLLNLHEKWMTLALRQARLAASLGEVPVGAVIVRGQELISAAHNDKEVTQNALRHAEMIAIGMASEKLSQWRLNDCTLYVTLEPCPMCAGALIQARVGNLVFGAVDSKGGGVVSRAQILDVEGFNHKVAYESGVLRDQCSQVLTDFFREKRAPRHNV